MNRIYKMRFEFPLAPILYILYILSKISSLLPPAAA